MCSTMSGKSGLDGRCLSAMEHGPSTLARGTVRKDDRVDGSLEVSMIATQPPVDAVWTRPVATRLGYTMAILVNAAMLVIANNILDWGWPPFLADDFGRILWLLDLSFLGAIMVNVIYLGYD